MKFILLVEDNGYQVRFWNEMSQEIGSVIVESWDKSELYKKLLSKNFKIEKFVFNEAIKKIELEDKPFVVLKSKDIDTDSINYFINETFTIDDEE